ncbi:hypothetical protein [Kistimonas asteriae]|uniref:hypothetical protein n=1 Tax=Kistimonas asteriae TaxID=517724 RepID=UPI001BA5B658|nr:hypothetical protein [Kistimonas asteriae]
MYDLVGLRVVNPSRLGFSAIVAKRTIFYEAEHDSVFIAGIHAVNYGDCFVSGT